MTAAAEDEQRAAEAADAAVEMPWLDKSTLETAKKSEIVEFLQRHMSTELLRKHKLFGKVGPIAKKAKMPQLHKVYMQALDNPTLLISGK